MKTVTVLGATGSVGSSTIALLKAHKDRYAVDAVVANQDGKALADVARSVDAKIAVVANQSGFEALKDGLEGSNTIAQFGEEALIEAASRPVDRTISAIVGAAGLTATAAAVRAGNDIALANKECLICGGEAFKALVAKHNVRLLPLDSEHNALYQLLEGKKRCDIQRLTLTASGGPFREWPTERLARAKRSEALSHPTWSMGDKISIDSATLMNKGLELIEARYLFDLEPDSLDVVVHPQSIIHALITFRDGSTHAEMGVPDMRRPIAHCLAWPSRLDWQAPTLNLAELGSLTFQEPDEDRFPALSLARHAMQQGGGTPNALNAANEIAVNAFLDDRIPFTTIVEIVAETLATSDRRAILGVPGSIEEALALDNEARQIAATHLQVRLDRAS